MGIQENMVYDKCLDKIDGFVDYGDNRVNELAKSVCVFMARSLCGKFKHILFYVATPSPIPANMIDVQIQKSIEICKSIGLITKGIVCDQGPTNRKYFKDKGVALQTPFFRYDNQTIFTLYDVPHLFKSIRNNLLSYDFDTPDGLVSWEVIKFVYNLEKDENNKICPKLSHAHIYPTNFQKMSVKLAVQVLSRSVAKGILAIIGLDGFPEHLKHIALNTSKFIEKLDRLFDILNGQPVFMRDESTEPFLIEMQEYILKIKMINQKQKSYCLDGLVMSISSILQISRQLFNTYPDITFINWKKFNQDPLENFFSRIRARNANKQNPNLAEFRSIYAKLVSMKLIFESKFSNCESDTDTQDLLEIDWSAITDISETQISKNNDENSAEITGTKFFTSVNNDNLIEKSSHINNAAISYFAGYCIMKMQKKLGKVCNDCLKNMAKDSTSEINPSEILITLKQYKNIDNYNGLIHPSLKFYEICRKYANTFSRIFKVSPHSANIRQILVHECIHESEDGTWFDETHPCHNHRLEALEFFMLVMLRKNCKWEMDSKKMSKIHKYSKNKKIINVTNT